MKDRFKQIREHFALSQPQLALEIHRPQGVVSAIERGLIQISPEIFRSLREAFGISTQWLLTGEGEMFLPGREVEKVEIERIGQRVRKVRKDMGLTLDQFSRRIGYSLNQVAVVEKAKSKPSDKLLRKVADVGQVRFRWLRYGDGEMLLEEINLVDEKLIAWLRQHPDVIRELKQRSDWDKRITEDRIKS